MIDVANLQSLLTFYEFNTAFRTTALERIAPLVKEDAGASTAVAEALTADRATRQLEGDRSKQIGPDARGEMETVELDRQIDRTIASIPQQLDVILAVLRPGDPSAEEAKSFVAELLPRGVAAVVQTTFVEELSECDRILERLATKSALASRFGFEPIRQRLAELVTAQRAALGRVKVAPIPLDTVRAAQHAGRERFAAIIFRLVAANSGPTPEAVAARRRLLQPVVELNEQLREAYRRAGGRVADSVEPAPASPPAPK